MRRGNRKEQPNTIFVENPQWLFDSSREGDDRNVVLFGFKHKGQDMEWIFVGYRQAVGDVGDTRAPARRGAGRAKHDEED